MSDLTGVVISEPVPPDDKRRYWIADVAQGGCTWYGWPVPEGSTIGDPTPMEWAYPGSDDPEVNTWYLRLRAKTQRELEDQRERWRVERDGVAPGALSFHPMRPTLRRPPQIGVTVLALIGIGLSLTAIGIMARPSVDPAALVVAMAGVVVGVAALVVRIATAKRDGT